MAATDVAVDHHCVYRVNAVCVAYMSGVEVMVSHEGVWMKSVGSANVCLCEETASILGIM